MPTHQPQHHTATQLAGGARGEANGNYRAGQYTEEIIAGRKERMTAWRWLVAWRKENNSPDKEEWLYGNREEVTVAFGTACFRQ